MLYLKEKFAATVRLAETVPVDGHPDSGEIFLDHLPGSGPRTVVMMYTPVQIPPTAPDDDLDGPQPPSAPDNPTPEDTADDAAGEFSIHEFLADMLTPDGRLRAIMTRLGTFAEITLDTEHEHRLLRRAHLEADALSNGMRLLGTVTDEGHDRGQVWHLVDLSPLSLVGAVEVDLHDPAFLTA